VDATGDTKWLTHSTLAATEEAIISEGIATADEVTTVLAALADATADPATIIGLPRTFQVWAKREAHPTEDQWPVSSRTGMRTCEGRAVSWNTVWRATTISLLWPGSAVVFRLRSYRSNSLDEISTRSRWPAEMR
jgi:hypothetical protein